MLRNMGTAIIEVSCTKQTYSVVITKADVLTKIANAMAAYLINKDQREV